MTIIDKIKKLISENKVIKHIGKNNKRVVKCLKKIVYIVTILITQVTEQYAPGKENQRQSFLYTATAASFTRIEQKLK